MEVEGVHEVQQGAAVPSPPAEPVQQQQAAQQPEQQAVDNAPRQGDARDYLLQYEAILLTELLEEDALCILASGLGLQRLVAALLALHHAERNGALLLLGAQPWQRDAILSELRRQVPTAPAAADINNEVPATERIELYRSNAAAFVTARILVVDFLSARLQPRHVAGIIVLNAHRVTDTNGEGFAVRLFRSGNTGGYVRAFSDMPTAFAGGFNKVEKVMRALYVRRLRLWPRFQDDVQAAMDASPPEVEQRLPELSQPVLMIQAAIMEVLESLLKDLRKSNKIDMSDLNIEGLALHKAFEEALRRQLDPVWNSVGWKTRQIVKDMRTLRATSQHLIHYDSVTFLAFLESLRLSEGARCLWLFHDASHTIFEQARKRVFVFRLQRQLPGSEQPDGAGKGRKRKAPSTAAGGSKGSGKGAAKEPEVNVLIFPGEEEEEEEGAGGGEGGAAGQRGTSGTAGRAPTGGTSDAKKGALELEPVLEEVPKWGELRHALREIQQERAMLRGVQAGQPHPFMRMRTPPACTITLDMDDDEMGNGGQQQQQQVKPEVSTMGPPRRQPAGPTTVKGRGDVVSQSLPVKQEDECIVISDSSDDDVQVLGQTGGAARGAKTSATAAKPAQAAARPGAGAQANQKVEVKDEDHKATGVDGITEGPSHVQQEGEAILLTEEEAARLRAAGSAPVMVVSREPYSCKQLEMVMRAGGRAVLQASYEAYLFRLREAKQSGRSLAGGGGRGGKGGGWRGRGRGQRGAGSRDLPPVDNLLSGADVLARGPVMRQGEVDALMAAAAKVQPPPSATAGPRKGRRGLRVVATNAAGKAPCKRTAKGGAGGTAAGAGSGAGEAGPSGPLLPHLNIDPGAAAAAGAGDRGRQATAGSGAAKRRRKHRDDSPPPELPTVNAMAAAAATAAEVQGEGPSAGMLGPPAAAGAAAGTLQGPGVGAAQQGSAEGELQPGEAAGSGAQAAQGTGPGARGRGRGRGATAGAGPGRGRGRKGSSSSVQQQQADGKAKPATSRRKARSKAAAGNEGTGRLQPQGTAAAGPGDPILGAAGATGPELEPGLLEGVVFRALDAHCEQDLATLCPSYVVLYDPDLAFLRQLEVYKAGRPDLRLLVVILTYDGSVEQQAFAASVEREISVFSSLIEFKPHIAIPIGLPPAAPTMLLPRGAAANDADQWLDVYGQNAITRVAGRGAAPKALPRRLVVDMREFMSSLPAVLHQQGFELVPVTLEVGDYVLSPTCCVERKAIPDLISSLASGRLYSQAEAMCKHYRTPVLLIEFDGDKPFMLQSPSELGDDIDAKAVGSKLVLLTLHFPRLRLVWSRSLHATADIFASLKSNMDEPDPQVAQTVGVPIGPDGQLLSSHHAAAVPSVLTAAAPQVNQVALDVLRRLPGVNDSNFRPLTQQLDCLADLATCSLERLEQIMGGQRAARMLYDFLHAPCPRAGL